VAATAQLSIPARTASPIALWHLLSLDAPTVAALWTWFIARACDVSLPLASTVAMALAVWILYAGDRLLDSRALDAGGRPHSDELEARHLFHRRNRRAFLSGIVLSAATLAVMLPELDPAAIRLYLVEGALLAAWFVILHATHSAHRLPKEIAVGLFFAAAIFIPTVARGTFDLRLALVSSAIVFAALCSLNCLFIYAWEHEGTRWHPGRQPHATTRLAMAHLPAIGIAVAGAGIALVPMPSARASLIPAACALAAGLLLLLHRYRRRLSRTHLRAAADLALLTPLLLLPFLR